LSACVQLTPTEEQQSSSSLTDNSGEFSPSSEPVSTPSLFEVYFSDPYDPYARSRPGYLEDILVYAIDQANSSVDVAVLNLTSDDIGEALLRAHKRGVQVRLVMESDRMDRNVPRGLIKAGVPVVGDNGDGLMHHKFMVIDGIEVWSGSMNFTESGIYRDHNNMLRIRSSRLAQNYTAEFEEMFVDGLFGAESPANTPHPQITIDGTQIENYFSPDDGVEQQLYIQIMNAEESIAVMAFAFTSDPLAAALIERAENGLEVRIIMDEEQAYSNQGGEYEHFLNEGLDVRLDANYGQMHHKVMVFDSATVAFGSYNYSYSAETRNDENLLIIHDPALAAAYLNEFELIYERTD